MKKKILLGLGALILIAAIGQAFGIIKPKTEEERPTPTIKQEANSQVTDTGKEPVKIIGHRFDTVDKEIRLIILFNRPLSEDEVGNFLYPNYTYRLCLSSFNFLWRVTLIEFIVSSENRISESYPPVAIWYSVKSLLKPESDIDSP